MFHSSYFEKSFIRRKSSGITALALLTVTIFSLAVFHPETEFFQALLSHMCVIFRGPVTIFCFFCIAVLLFLVCSGYGNIRLGGEKAKPEFSTFSWLSCLFMAGCGIGIVFYCQEPILHYYNNPYTGNVPGDPVSVAYSLTLFNKRLGTVCPARRDHRLLPLLQGEGSENEFHSAGEDPNMDQAERRYNNGTRRHIGSDDVAGTRSEPNWQRVRICFRYIHQSVHSDVPDCGCSCMVCYIGIEKGCQMAFQYIDSHGISSHDIDSFYRCVLS